MKTVGHISNPTPECGTSRRFSIHSEALTNGWLVWFGSDYEDSQREYCESLDGLAERFTAFVTAQRLKHGK